MKRRRRFYQLGGGYSPNETELQNERAVNAGIGVVGAINPVIGAGLTIGKAIGNAARDEDGLYKSKFGEFAANSFDPVTGIQNLQDLRKNFTGTTVANQLSLGLLGKSATQMRREKEKQIRERREYNTMVEGANSKLLANNYDFTGSLNEDSIYAKMGGQLPSKRRYLASGGYFDQLNSDTVEVKGNTHEQGGVKIPGAELENNETVTGNYVFSDYLGFADRHKKLASQIGKIEKKPINRERRVTLEILRKKEEALKQEQESLKQMMGVPEVPPMMQLGGYVNTRYNGMQKITGPFKDARTATDFMKGLAYTEPEGMPAVDRNYAQQPMTLAEYRRYGKQRDWNKYPGTADEYAGWTKDLKGMREANRIEMNYLNSITSDPMKVFMKRLGL